MNKNYMVNEIKNEMKACIDGINGNNLFERRSRVEKLFDLMELLYDIETETTYPRRRASRQMTTITTWAASTCVSAAAP